MMSRTLVSMLAIAFAAVAINVHAAETDQQLIDNASSAAPAAVGREAAVVTVGEKGEMSVLREGTNKFTCIPDNPNSPGNDPMCLDENGMEWAKAWISGTEPPAGKIGFGYMLQSGSDASNTDPAATEPAAGANWVTTGPHVMIFNAGTTMQGYPDPGEAPDTSQPYVMWADTPYAHLMIPVE